MEGGTAQCKKLVMQSGGFERTDEVPVPLDASLPFPTFDVDSTSPSIVRREARRRVVRQLGTRMTMPSGNEDARAPDLRCVNLAHT